jgi:23S rRNA (cytosine1962-C5)-methyltransferase
VFAAGSAALPIAIAITAIALFGVGAVLSLFTGRSAWLSGLRTLALGALQEVSRSPSVAGRRERRLKAHTAAKVDRRQSHRAPREERAVVAQPMPARDGPALVWHPGARSRRACATRGFSPAPIERVEAILHPGNRHRGRRRRDFPRFAAVFAGIADSRARMVVRFAQTIDHGVLHTDVARAARARRALRQDHTAGRILHGESDGLPGVIADRYEDVVVLQCLSAGAERWRDVIAAACRKPRRALRVRALGRRSKVARRPAGAHRTLNGVLPDVVTIIEDGIIYRIDVVQGQKTGFYLDQRDNRRIVRGHAAGRRVLNGFCYTGGFSLAALAGGAASVLSIDSSGDALDLARDNLARNGTFDPRARNGMSGRVRGVAQVTRLGRGVRHDRARSAEIRAYGGARRTRGTRVQGHQPARVQAAGAGRIARYVFVLGGISADLFQKIVAGAALDAHADGQIIGHLTAGGDHPVALNFPEGDYLKGLLIRKA